MPIPRPGRYRLRITDQKTIFTIRLPAGVPLVTRAFLSPDLSPRVYFYVPKGLRRMALYVPGVIPVTFTDSNGKEVPYSGDKLAVIDVPPGEDGKIWSLHGYKSWSSIHMLNLPRVFALSPESLMVPADALHPSP